MKYDVFISYSRKDTAIADKICSALEHQRITYFIDRKGIGGGMEFPQVLAEAIMNSSIMLFLGSKNSYESKFTSNEVTFAFNKMAKGSIIPYVIDNSTLPPALEFTFSSINIRTIQEHPIETTLMKDLCHILKREYIEINKFNKQLTPGGLNDNNPQSPVGKEKNIPNSSFDVNVKSNQQKGTGKSTTTPNIKPSSKNRNEGKHMTGTSNPIKSSQRGPYEMKITERIKLYRALGMINAAKELERNIRKDSNWWERLLGTSKVKEKERNIRKDSDCRKLFYFFFDFSQESILNYLITLLSLVALIMLMYYYGYFNNHPFLVSELLITLLISFVGMRCTLNLGLATDDSEEITNFLNGVVLIPFIVLFSPIWSLLIAGILWGLCYHIFNFTLFHSTGVIYLIFSTASFTLITLIYTLYKRKKKHSG